MNSPAAGLTATGLRHKPGPPTKSMTSHVKKEIAEFLCKVAATKPQDENAEKVYKWAKQLDGMQPEAYNGLGRVAFNRKDYRTAVKRFHEALHGRFREGQDHTADAAKIILNKGVAHHRLGDLSAAKDYALQSVAVDKKCLSAYLELASIYEDTNRQGSRIEAIEAGLRHFPDSSELHCCKFYYLAYHRRWIEAWEQWQYRKTRFEIADQMRNVCEWDGSAIPGKRLLVIGENGIGDQIMFSRWLPIAAERSQAQVTFHPCGCPGAVDWPGHDGSVPDYWIALESLPYTTQTPMPRGFIGLKQSASVRRVGYCFAVNPKSVHAATRTVPVDDYEPLLNHLRQRGVEVVDLLPTSPDVTFTDTRRVLRNCDLVIGVPTAATHLAASMGIPTWVAIRKPYEWRWGANGDRAIWYDSMAIFRQAEPNKWADVIAAMQAALPL